MDINYKEIPVRVTKKKKISHGGLVIQDNTNSSPTYHHKCACHCAVRLPGAERGFESLTF